MEAAAAQLEEADNRHKTETNSLKKKHQMDLEEVRTRLQSTLKAKIEVENQLKKMQQLNKVTHNQKKKPYSKPYLFTFFSF